ncbi:hypothetical protein [Serpentinimonas maccroryi]|uniref:hypothetical protein n=1 Tax=Serpentinimonas maccroryi TaxID=1458426 RepID=UPI00203329CF|nr:hypothetical protein [Serpentinimonas maccroryi]MCM2480199.1 hypothetical protein [Serpentinimonas maccroryi]
MVAAKKTSKPGAEPAAPPATEPASTRSYVVRTGAVLHDGRTYRAGAAIELTPAQAARLGSLVRLAPNDPEPPLE